MEETQNAKIVGSASESVSEEIKRVMCDDGVVLEYFISKENNKSVIEYITFKFCFDKYIKFNITLETLSNSSVMEWDSLVVAVKKNKYGAMEFHNENGGCDIEIRGDHVKFNVVNCGTQGAARTTITVPASKCLTAFKEVHKLMENLNN
jgi:hypothetical protein